MVYLFVMYFLMSFMGIDDCIVCSKALLKSVGIKAYYYPKKYVDLPQFLRKFYRVSGKKVARFIYFEMLMPFVYLALIPINLITLLIPNALVVQSPLYVRCAISIVEKGYVVGTALFWKRKK